MELDFYENLQKNMDFGDWEAVWDDSFRAKQGIRIRRHLHHDGESCGPKSAYDEQCLSVITLTLLGDYICGQFE